MWRLAWSLIVMATLGLARAPGAAPAEAETATAAPRLPLSRFAAPPRFIDAALSPDGRYLATVTWQQERYFVLIKDLDAPAGAEVNAVDPGPGRTFNWVHWAAPRRLLAATVTPLAADRQLVLARRLIALDPDGGHAVQLVAPKGKSRTLVLDTIVDLLPEDSAHILMSASPRVPGRPDVYKVDLYRGLVTKVQKGRKGISMWMTDRQGRLRIGVGIVRDLYMISARNPQETRWRTLWQTEVGSPSTFTPVAFGAAPDTLLVLSNHESGRKALYAFDLARQSFTHRLFGHPEVDLSSAVLGPYLREVLAVGYIVDRPRFYYLDPDLRAVMDGLRPVFPGKQIRLLSITPDHRRAVIYTEAPTDPGHLYLFDRTSDRTPEGRLTEFGAVNPTLEGRFLAATEPLSYRARDGLLIHGYLTLPAGTTRSDLKQQRRPPPPLVVMPHGGPSARDFLRYDYTVQFLANRGYAVFQMNFRGSTGYGTWFERKGYRAWGQEMQDDITDGTRFLIAEGLAAPGRICIFGGSYGGYAALMGVVKTPALFACAISLGGVSDLRAFVKSAARTAGKARLAHIGDVRRDRKMLDRYSPVKRVREIRSPVLLLHGELDATVPAEQSRRMARALHKAGKEYRFITLAGTAHALRTRNDRERVLREVERFLDRTIGPARPARHD